MTLTPRVALSQDFLLKLGKLPSSAHTRIVKWALKFQQDPTSPGINYETIRATRDSNLRSVRIDQDWRGIIFKPEIGDVYILLHVGPHDEAYRWAERRKVAINPATGALQIVNLENVEASEAEAHPSTKQQAPLPKEAASKPLFASLTDEALVQLGTPVELIAVVRAMHDEQDLDAAQTALPIEAYEGLFLIVAGDTVSKILSERETRVDRKVDTSDFATALAAAESQSRFVVVTDDAEMAAILNAPLAQWRVFLHPTQRKLSIGDRSGPVRVLGGAGTGKTVLAMHRAKWLAKNRATANQKVLFTTFTRNLALDIEHNLKSLFLDDAAISNIEIVNLDRWVHRYLRRKDWPHQIIYQRDPQAWGRAMEVVNQKLALDEQFYVDEWEQVIAAQGVQTLDDYRRASRVGRKSILARSARDMVWPVFEEYREQLSGKRLKDVDDAYHDVRLMLDEDKAPSPYCAIVVDETQDLGPQALRLLRAMIPPGTNDLFFVGDGHQRIYSKHRAVMSRCGIDIRGRSRKLYLNYRTTDEIRKVAVALLEGREIDDLDGGADDNQRYKSLSHGPAPDLVTVNHLHDGVEVAVNRVRQWLAQHVDGSPPSICVMAHRKDVRDLIGRKFSDDGIAVAYIEADTADSGGEAVRVSTMHRAKGLEFDRVVVVVPGVLNDSEDRDFAQLVYVALTRAKTAAILIR